MRAMAMTEQGPAAGGFFGEDITFISHSSAETFSFGRLLGERLDQGDVVALCGELGAGKTCLTQGIASGLGVPEEYPVTSPTFTIINEYPGRFDLYHLDMYRLSSADELEDIGYDVCFDDRGVTVVEWGEKVLDFLPERTLFVVITYIDDNTRQFSISRNREGVDHLMSEAQGGW